MAGENPWRDVNFTIGDCLEYIYGENYQPDVTFTFDKVPGEQVHAHKLVLCMRSHEVVKLFYGPTASKTNVIECPKNSPAAIREFISYMYSDTLNLTLDIAVECLSLARKYKLREMVSRSEEFIEDCISVPTVLKLYSQCRQFEQTKHEAICLDYIMEYGDRVLTLETLDELAILRKEDFEQIVRQDELACDEDVVLQIALRWAVGKCLEHQKTVDVETIREEMGGVLFAIWFPVMTLASFRSLMSHIKLLTPEEQALIVRHLKNSWKLDSLPATVGPFSAVPRPGSGSVNIHFPVAKATDLCIPGSCVLDIVTDGDSVQLNFISGKHFCVDKKATVYLSIPGVIPMLCPLRVSKEKVEFRPPIRLGRGITNTFTFQSFKPSLQNSKDIRISRRVRDCNVRVDRIPLQADCIQLHFND